MNIMKKRMPQGIGHLLTPIFLLLLSSKTMKGEVEEAGIPSVYSIGAIVDYSSRVGKEQLIAMKMAIEDTSKDSDKLILHSRDSSQDITHTATAAMDLINVKQVSAVLGLRMWDKIAFTAELGDRAEVPVLSLSDDFPIWVSKKWPFLVQATHKHYKQMSVVAAIVGSWQWKKVNFIYEDTGSATISIVSQLIDALHEVGSRIENILTIPPVATSFWEELGKLKRKQCQVFIVHTSLPVAEHLFVEAKKMGLMDDNSVWITTSAITDHFGFLNSSIISSMQGVIGVKTYYPQTGRLYKAFISKFRRRIVFEHPGEMMLEPGIFALQSYDATQALVRAFQGRTGINSTSKLQKPINNSSRIHGHELLENIYRSDFLGLTGEFQFIDGALAPSNIFRIVNVIGDSYRGLGFWFEGLGFSKNAVKERSTYNMSMSILGQVLWPGGTWSVPSGWAPPTSENPLMIGVPESPTFNQFVNVRYDGGGKPSVNGYSIDVFKAVLGYLPYHLPYEFVPYNGTYDSLVEQIYDKKFDAVVGDTSIVAHRCNFAQFSQPWTESGLQMAVYKNSVNSNRAWLFLKPFTTAMWGFTACINLYNGFSVWLMERKHHPEFNGSAWNKVGALIWLAFTTLFSLQGDRLHSNLPRMTMVVWLFLALIIIQSYTASLTSMLTIPRIEAKDITLEYLKKSNAKVGCDEGSFVIKYLEDVLGLHPQNIRPFSSYTDYPHALQRGEIAAVFLEVPYMKLFLAEHCKDYAIVGPTYKVGGFGFVFAKESPILPDISKAVLEVSENGKLLELENALISNYNCSSSKPDNDSLGVTSFLGLFLISGGTTTISLVLYFFRMFMRSKQLAKQKQLNRSRHAKPGWKHDPDIDEVEMFASEMENGRQRH